MLVYLQPSLEEMWANFSSSTLLVEDNSVDFTEAEISCKTWNNLAPSSSNATNVHEI